MRLIRDIVLSPLLLVILGIAIGARITRNRSKTERFDPSDVHPQPIRPRVFRRISDSIRMLHDTLVAKNAKMPLVLRWIKQLAKYLAYAAGAVLLIAFLPRLLARTILFASNSPEVALGLTTIILLAAGTRYGTRYISTGWYCPRCLRRFKQGTSTCSTCGTGLRVTCPCCDNEVSPFKNTCPHCSHGLINGSMRYGPLHERIFSTRPRLHIALIAIAVVLAIILGLCIAVAVFDVLQGCALEEPPINQQEI